MMDRNWEMSMTLLKLRCIILCARYMEFVGHIFVEMRIKKLRLFIALQ